MLDVRRFVGGYGLDFGPGEHGGKGRADHQVAERAYHADNARCREAHHLVRQGEHPRHGHTVGGQFGEHDALCFAVLQGAQPPANSNQHGHCKRRYDHHGGHSGEGFQPGMRTRSSLRGQPEAFEECGEAEAQHHQEQDGNR